MLQRRHILVLVHRQPADRGADGGADLREPVQQVAGDQQDVVEINLPLRGLHRLVGAVELHEPIRLHPRRRAAVQRRTHPRIVLRGDQRHLGPVDLGVDVAQIALLRLQFADPCEGLGHQPALVVRDMRERGLAHFIPDAQQLVQRGGVEGGGGHGLPDAEFGQPHPHLGGGLHREGDRQRPRRIPGARRAGVGDAARHRAGFARTGHGHDAHRSVHRRRGGTLRLVQTVQNRIRRSCHAPIVPCFALHHPCISVEL